MRKANRWCVAASAIALALALAGCSSPSEVSADTSDADSGASSTTSGDAGVALETAYTGQVGAPPTVATVPKAGVDLWVVSCGEQVPGCSIPSAAVEEAGKALGWKVSLCDGQLNPNGWGTCVRQAVSAGAEVLIPIGIDCSSIQQPFEEAKSADVTVIGGGGVDCDASGGEKLWASERLQLDGLTAQQTYELQGQLAADWLIGKTDGKAQVVQLAFTDSVWGPWLNSGFEKELATCADCSVVSTLEYSNQDVGSGQLAQKFATTLLQAPDANAVFFPMGGVVNLGLAQAVVASGRAGDLQVITALGGGPNFDLVRSNGGLNAVVGYPVEWGSWGSVDTAIRVLNGEEPVVQGDGYQVVDAEHNMPAEGEPFSAGVDYQAAYLSAWGL